MPPFLGGQIGSMGAIGTFGSAPKEVLEAWEQLASDLNEYGFYALYLAYPDDTLGTYPDRSGNSRDGEQLTSADAPIPNQRLVGGRPSYACYTGDFFDAHSDLYSLPSGDNTVYILCRSRTSGGSEFQTPFVGLVSTSSRWFVENSNDTNNVNFGNSTSFNPISLAQDPAADIQVIVTTRSGADMYLRKKTPSADDNTTGTNGVDVTPTSVRIGDRDLDMVAIAFADSEHDDPTKTAVVTLLENYAFVDIQNAASTSTAAVSNGASIPIWNSAYPMGVYDSTADKTFFAYVTTPDTVDLSISIQEYNHATSAYGTANEAILNYTYASANYHGVPCVNVDPDGYIHVIGGSHNSTLKYAISDSPRDISAFTAQSDISGNYTYPKLAFVGSTGYLFVRGQYTDYDFYLRKTTSLSGGAATWGAHSELLTFGTNTRAYAGNYVINGTDIIIPLYMSDSGDTFRQDLFVIVYDTTNDTIRNMEDTVSYGSGDWPISGTDMDTYFRVVNMGSDTATGTPNIALINGNPIVVYGQGDSSISLWDINVIEWNGTAWGTPVRIGQAYEQYASVNIIVDSSNNVVVRWEQDRENTGNSSLMEATRTGSTWSREVCLLDGDTISLSQLGGVKDAQDELNVFTANGLTGSGNVAGTYKIFGLGSSGVV